MQPLTNDSPADEYERARNLARRYEAEDVGRWARRALLLHLVAPLALCGGCLFAGPLGGAADDPDVREVLGLLAVAPGLLCLMASFASSVVAAVITLRAWALLGWPSRAFGLSGWLVFCTETAVLVLAALA